MCLFCLIGCCPLLPQMTTLMRKQGIGNLSEKAWSLGCYAFKGTYNTGTLFCSLGKGVYHFKAFMQCDDRTGCILHIWLDILNWTKNKQTKQVLRTLFVYFDPKRAHSTPNKKRPSVDSVAGTPSAPNPLLWNPWWWMARLVDPYMVKHILPYLASKTGPKLIIPPHGLMNNFE